FRKARPWHYLAVVLLRSPALLAATVVYTLALRLFGVEADFVSILGVLPLVFFGAATPGPMRAVAVSMWVLLFPEHPAQMTAFGLVMHNFFVFFNAGIGLLLLRKAQRGLFAAPWGARSVSGPALRPGGGRAGGRPSRPAWRARAASRPPRSRRARARRARARRGRAA